MVSRRGVLCGGLLAPILGAKDWPSYRGAGASGVADGSVPSSWNGDASAGPIRNVAWRVPVPGLGHSSPTVTGDRLFLLTAVAAEGNAPLKLGLYGSGDSAKDDGEQEWVLLCFDRRNGKLLWRQVAKKSVPRVRRHTKATHANTTAATDGKRVVALFGSEGLYCWSVDGRLLWQKDLGTLDMAPSDDRTLSWGFASSPVLFEDSVVIQADAKANGFLAVFSLTDGRERWRIARDKTSVCSWATPGVFRMAGRTQIVTNGFPWIAGYDFATGKELWRLQSGGDIPVPTPFTAHGLIYIANAHGSKAPLFAVRPEASGDITPKQGERSSSGVVWVEERNGSYLQTPVVYGDQVYACTSQGIFKSYDARTGRKLYEQRLGQGGSFTSSPVAAGGKVFVSNEDGETFVVEARTEFRLSGVNRLGEPILSTPAVVAPTLYVRTPTSLYALEG